MIFDFYLTYEFSSFRKDLIKPINFKDESLYVLIKGDQVSHQLLNGAVTCLHRRNYRDNFAEANHIKMWLFGYVYSTKYSAESINKYPFKLTAEQILRIMEEHPTDYVKHIKGSFALVFVNEEKKRITVVTDRLNVLPLYYAFNGKSLIISSNTAFMLKQDWVNKEYDPLALSMQYLFDYMLAEYYFFKGIRRCENAAIYEFSAEGRKKENYWDVSELYHEELLDKKSSLDLLADQLKENVNLYASDSDKILVSLTGGFDGRTNLAMLNRDHEDILCYSYGMPGSKQIRIPQRISHKTGIPYISILLEKEFLDDYYENTLAASYFSNGTAPVGFCNIPYAYKKLQSFSDTIITGLFGSEILRPLHNNGIQVNDQSFEIFLCKDHNEGIDKAIQNVLPDRYFADISLSDMKEEMFDFLNTHYFKKYMNFDRLTVFFFFIIQEGIRKYFSQEISIERVFVTTRFPYFDTDLIDLVYQTPWAGMYNGFLGKSKLKRRKGQLLYAHIINKYNPTLGKILLDRGYKPNDLLLPFPLNFIRIGQGVFHAKQYMREHGGNDTFKTETWAESTLKAITQTSVHKNVNTIFGDNLSTLFSSGRYLNHFLTYRHMSSLKAFSDYIKL